MELTKYEQELLKSCRSGGCWGISAYPAGIVFFTVFSILAVFVFPKGLRFLGNYVWLVFVTYGALGMIRESLVIKSLIKKLSDRIEELEKK